MVRNYASEIEKLQKVVEADSWAQGFLDSLHSQMKTSRRSLSKRQVEVLDKISAEHTAEAIAAKAKWEKEYRKLYRADAIVVATYYSHTGYFREATQSILSDENYVPSINLFNKITCERVPINTWFEIYLRFQRIPSKGNNIFNS